MNQLERNSSRRSSSAGRSRARGSDKGSGRSSRGRSASAGRANAAQTARRNSAYNRKRRDPDYRKIAIGGVILIVLIALVAWAVSHGTGGSSQESTQALASEPETEMEREVAVDGISITGMSRSQARTAILKEYPWNMTVTYGDDSYQVTDLLGTKVDSLLDEIYGSAEPQESYTLDTSGMDEAAAAEAAACASRWNKKAKNGSIDSFDKETNKFVFAGEENGFAIDEEKLTADILQAVQEKRFDAVIEAGGETVAPEISAAAAKEKYKTISSFTTNTTSNKKRNTNIKLSAEALNGTVVKPGQEFSFNGTVGQRTEAKGYQSAAAYNNGEVVQETGGGVCQVSTTLYNAVFRSGLGGESISYRRSHTFEPNYVTPGQDATVSWDQPDFKFINTSSTAIGIRASYADQKVTVSIYGIPILEDGVTWGLDSKKVEDLGVPAPTYEEDQTLQPGQEVKKSAGSSGSRWETYKVVYQNGKEVSRELDHKTTYKGHAPVIRRNTTGVVLTPEETTTPAETAAPTIDGMPEGYVPGESESSGTAAPGAETTAAASSAAASAGPDSSAATTAAATTAASPAPTAAPAPETTASAGPGGEGAVLVPVKPE